MRTLVVFPDAVVSRRGLLAYVAGEPNAGEPNAGEPNAGGAMRMQAVWVDRRGVREVPDADWTGVFNGGLGMDLSPDGRRVAIGMSDGSSDDIWVKELPRGTFTRLTFEGRATRPRWSADGSQVLYLVLTTEGGSELRVRRADVTGAERVLLARALA